MATSPLGCDVVTLLIYKWERKGFLNWQQQLLTLPDLRLLLPRCLKDGGGGGGGFSGLTTYS